MPTVDRIAGTPTRKRSIPSAGSKLGRHPELLAMAEPAPDRLVQARLQFLAHVDERRRAGPAVQVLVAAADGEVGAARLQGHGHRAGRMAHVPEDQGPGRMRDRVTSAMSSSAPER